MKDADEMLNKVVNTIGENIALVNEALTETLKMHTEFLDRLLAIVEGCVDEGNEDEEWEI